MTQTTKNATQPIHPVSAAKRMLQGGAIALILISAFLLFAGEPNPNWPKFWMMKPLILVPLAGALGGLFYYNMDHLRNEGAWRKVLALILSLLVYLLVLWVGTVLGLHGTMWD